MLVHIIKVVAILGAIFNYCGTKSKVTRLCDVTVCIKRRIRHSRVISGYTLSVSGRDVFATTYILDRGLLVVYRDHLTDCRDR